MSLSKEKWFINEGELDNEQYNIKRMSLEKSYIVKGCAGSGKTVLAIWRAIEIIGKDQDCIILVFTTALKQFIEDALSQNPITMPYIKNVMTYDSWVRKGRKSVPHIVVDEVQDFAEEEIMALQKNASTSLALFGDSAQKLYPVKTVRNHEAGTSTRVRTLSVEEIGELLDLPLKVLRDNHRLPRKIAAFAQHLQSAVGVSLESQCKKEGEKKPLIAICDNEAEELELVLAMIKSKGLRDVGILLPDNHTVDAVHKELLSRRIQCEIKYNHENDFTKNLMTLDFLTDNPKLITYHSAKGLQFEYVFVPYCSRFNNRIKEKSPLYVALTRASTELVITCSKEIHSYLEGISPDLYDLQDFTRKPF